MYKLSESDGGSGDWIGWGETLRTMKSMLRGFLKSPRILDLSVETLRRLEEEHSTGWGALRYVAEDP